MHLALPHDHASSRASSQASAASAPVRRPRRVAARRWSAGLALALGVSALAPAALAEPERSLDQVRAQVEQLREQAAVAGEAYNDARLQVADVTTRLEAAEEREAAQGRAVAELRGQMAQVARDAYKDGGLGTELGLLMSGDPDDYLARVSDVEQLGRRQQRTLTGFVEAQEQLAADRAAVAARLGEVREAEARVEREKRAAEQALGAAEAELRRLTEEQRRALEAAQAAAERARGEAAARVSRSAERGASAAPAPVVPGSGTAVSCGGRAVQAPNGRAAAVLRFACAQLGDPYLYGASGPDRWDCSGLTMVSWAQAGVSLPHSSRAQYSAGTRISRSQLQPGDLVFSFSPISHVSIYIGDGLMLYAPRAGSSVKINPVDVMPYTGAVRL